MASSPTITVRDGATGQVALLNGKTYTLLRLYADARLDGPFFLAVAGKVPLRPDDLAEHWQVVRSGDVYLALNARPFSYHLIEGEGTPTDAPHWPRLKTPADYYAFVGPTEAAAHTQMHLTLERYHSPVTLDEVLPLEVPDRCGGPPALLLKADTVQS